jgi:hypothetical protein
MLAIRSARSLALLLILLLVGVPIASGQATGIDPVPAPLGPHVGFQANAFDGVPSFSASDKVVMTQYFYWYDSASNAHIRDADGSDALTTHPANLTDYSYKSAAWHRRQLEDMMAAGIDIVLPVYWGAPSEREPGSRMHWSFEGLTPLVQALDAIVAEGKRPPRVGLFYDTSTLQWNSSDTHVDLTTPEGRNWFYASIRDFFSMIPPRHWALIDGKPVVQLYSAAFATAHDQRTIDDLKTRFAQDFGGKVPYVIRDVSWNVKADNAYAWGGAIKPNFLGVAEIGPGYDHSAVEGREPLVVDREQGAHYEQAWQKAIRLNPHIVIIETWNEHHEGTDIADSREYGRTYIDLTRTYVDRWRSGWTPPAPSGPYAGKPSVSIELGATDLECGLKRIEVADGGSEPVKPTGRRLAPSQAGHGRYLYFAVDDSFKTGPNQDLTVTVQCDRTEAGSLALEYDSNLDGAPFGGAYTPTEAPGVIGTGTVNLLIFHLKNPRLAGLENGGADFRLVGSGEPPVVSKVTVQRGNFWSPTARNPLQRIVLSPQPTESERYAASELHRYLEKMGLLVGAVVEATEAVEPTAGEIRLVSTDAPNLGTDGYRLVHDGATLRIEGGRPRGILNGVYGLLEDHLGVQWLAPDVEVVPAQAAVALAPFDETVVPALRQREVYWSTFIHNPDFAARNRLNGQSYALEARHGGRAVVYHPFVHSLDLLVPTELFATHPEYFPLIDGKRQNGYVQRCLTNPDVLNLSIERVQQWLKDHPEVTTVSVSQNDTINNCQCPSCKAIDDAEGTPMGSFLTFVNAVADAIAADHPNIRIDTLAYQYTRKPPATLRPRPNVEIRLCSIECCFAHPLDSGCSEANRRFLADLEAWKPIAPHLTVWDYTTNFAHYQQPFPNFDAIGPNVRLFVTHGVNGLFEQGNYSPGGHGEMEPLRAYLLAKLVWNPSADVDSLTNSFLSGYYGTAASAMRRYLDRLQAQVRGKDVHAHIFEPAKAFLDSSFVAEANAILDEAEAQAANDSDAAVAKRVRTERVPVWYAQLALGGQTPEARRATLDSLVKAAREAGISHISEGRALEDWIREQEAVH